MWLNHVSSFLGRINDESDILGIRETGIALMEIALEDAGLASSKG